jgi:hypothetical protein
MIRYSLKYICDKCGAEESGIKDLVYAPGDVIARFNIPTNWTYVQYKGLFCAKHTITIEDA